jgi:hypothetical protein
MKKSSVEKWLWYYFENWICLINPKSLNVFYEKVFAYSSKGFKTHRVETVVTIGYYLSQLGKTCRFIIWHLYYPTQRCEYCGRWIGIESEKRCRCRIPQPYDCSMDFRDIARILNEIQNTQNYNSYRVEEIYIDNIKKLEGKFRKAKLLRGGRWMNESQIMYGKKMLAKFLNISVAKASRLLKSGMPHIVEEGIYVTVKDVVHKWYIKRIEQDEPKNSG